MSAINDEELIRGCVSHDRICQQKLYYKYGPKMKGVCRMYAQNSEEADDFMQEGFIKVFLNIHKYSGKGSLEGWIRKVIINSCLSILRKSKRLKTDTLDNYGNHEGYLVADEDQNLEEAAFLQETDFSQEDLLKCIHSIPEIYRIVFTLFYIEDYSHKEIGDSLSIDEATSRSRLSRARKLIKSALERMSIKQTQKR